MGVSEIKNFMPKKIEISHKTIIFSVFFLISLWLIYIVRQVILEFFLALLITAILNPLITNLSKHKIPRSISVLIVYTLLLLLFSVTIAAIIPPLIDQTSEFINNLPRFLKNLGISAFFSDQIVEQLISQIGGVPGRIAKFTLSIFSNLLAVVAVLVFAFYLLSDRENLDKQLETFLGEKRNRELGKVIDLLEVRLGNWARGQFTLMLVVGALNYFGLTLLGVPFALPLAILAGFLEIVPYIGPIIAAIPAVFIGFGTSFILGIAVASLTFLVQQVENYVLVPKIMQKQAGVNPIATLLSLAIGFRLAGVIGLVISVPTFIMLGVLTKYYFESRS
ncbi:hypothetical protein A2686_03575 [Candidatus Woesebacteria bacterium RIFCSPHIGHO2_01_FULL_38_10]|uniref:AI-2E family transporter n=1 Tax=Candidatus Woesebacteria bacterium RIFCSPLOWO2_01_FULL_39_10b TaxID=1802517 RepID=A0A1F8B6U5_9BACT|nr:MAG: hypothetical protein A2686_03575 [Candidatus Woesebacteria bacterium RIFCSPHIGHO2_01_FULL_38_10]OGM59660.1 MAG: hypothetical protein A2892_04000 [Candidatus Woesebacteria bacterium RIFCSPLOWO2_01_FULL_39_10b]